MKRAAWRTLIRKLEIEKLMNTARKEELSKMLDGQAVRWNEKPQELPEINEETIMAVLNGYVESASEFIAEAVQEEFDWLRPRNTKHKTNSRFKVGRRVIKTGAIEVGYSAVQPYKACTYSEPHLVSLDSIFHMLDGKGIVKTYSGPLVEGIRSSKDGVGATDYFRFKCCKNGNLHLEFLREDLLSKFNELAGKNRLGDGS